MAATASTTRRVRWEVLPSTKAERKAGAMDWKTTRDGDLVGSFPNQAQAIGYAATVARAAWKTQGQLATLKIKRRNGQIRDERTYGRDPIQTKG